MSFAIDLHVHTRAGSADSSLSPSALRTRAIEKGLYGVHLSEHFRVWDSVSAADLVRGTALHIFRGMEWTTELGHIIVMGVDKYRPEIVDIAGLRKHVLDLGGMMIAAHPFRHAFDRVPAVWKAHKSDDLSLEAACQHPVLKYVDAIEVINGACTERENALSKRVAAALGLPEIGGSDAHYAEDIGRAVTVLERAVLDEHGLITEIRAGRVFASDTWPTLSAAG